LEAERVRADISAAELAGRINIPVHWVLDVEEGRVPLTVELVGIWCEELLRVPASPLLARAASQVPPGFHGLQIDIRLAAEMRPTEENYWSNGMVKWARGLLTEGSLPLVTVLNHDILRFSEEWGIESEFLITILHDFVPLRGKYIPVTEGQCT
jgi:transcriptional regulator with XRE-family HTH domain